MPHTHAGMRGIRAEGGWGVINTGFCASGISYNSTIPNWMPLTKARPVDLGDIRQLRRWYVEAALRSRSAGFDIIYVYAGMGYGPNQFLLPWLNKRTDEYGGCLPIASDSCVR